MRKRVGVVVSVATGMYLDYWKSLFQSYLRVYSDSTNQLDFVLFTDRTPDAEQWISAFDKEQVLVVPTQPEPWPQASMNRYFVYREHRQKLIHRGLPLIHLDADMAFERQISEELLASLTGIELALVEHPGFFRRHNWFEVFRSLPVRLVTKHLLGDIVQILRQGGIGAWERSRTSAAFVSWKKRRTYVCGGVWFASPQRFEELVSDMCERILEDQRNGVTALWHDESHLNAWFVDNESTTRLLDPSFCYASGFPHLLGIKPTILAVEKGPKRVR